MDDSGRRGHDQKLFKKRFTLDVRKFAFGNRVVDNWNLLSPQCVNCCTVNTFKKYLRVELEPETAMLVLLSFEIVGVYMAFQRVLTHTSSINQSIIFV